LAALLAAGAQPAYANTGPITPNGAPVTATVSTAKVPAKFTFSGTSGEVVTASAYGGTFAGSCDVDLRLLTPAGGVLNTAGCVGQTGFLQETVLPGSGTYTLELFPNNSDTGHVTLSLSANAANSAITANGAAVTFTATHTGQGRDYAFSGAAGEVITASASGGTFTNPCDLSLNILTNSGSSIGGGVCVAQSGFSNEIVLPGTGTYTLDVSPDGNDIGHNTGHVTLALSANAANSAITANGAAVTFTATHTGQGRDYTFSGTAGEVITASASGGTFTNGCDLSMSILTSSGSSISGAPCISQSGFSGEVVLPGTGTYTLDVTPNGQDIGHNTGHVTLSLSANAANSTIIANGAAVVFTATHTGQGRDYTFSGTAGEVVTASASGGTFIGGCDVSLTILSQFGSSMGGAVCAGQSGFTGEIVLPGTGTYTLDVYPQGSDSGHNTGHVTLALSANPANSTIAVNGAAVTFAATHTGQGRDYTFSGTAKEVITASASGGTFTNGCDLTMNILTNSGSVIGSAGCMAQSGSTGQVTLPATGTYTLDVVANGNDIGHNTGHVALTLRSP
jgi:hypothetical protein